MCSLLKNLVDQELVGNTFLVASVRAALFDEEHIPTNFDQGIRASALELEFADIRSAVL